MDKSLFMPPFNFGALWEDYSEYEKSGVVVLPVPYDGTATYKKGTGEGPYAIIKASRDLEPYDSELDAYPAEKGIHTLNFMWPASDSPGRMVEHIHKAVAPVVQARKKLVMLGGEHTITLGAVRAFSEAYKDLSVLQIDAHADCYENFEGGDIVHNTVIRRCSEICPVTQVGVRTLSEEEKEFLNNTDKVRTFYAKELHGMKDWCRQAVSSLSDNVYVTFDLDGLDPSIMPAVGTPEPNGLSWQDVMELFSALQKSGKNVVGFDVVELNPLPGNITPDFIAAKLVQRMIGMLF